ncbi:MAG: phenylalanine--tRNA ligase subunit beta [Lentisphaerae bacterium]|jgi:phenylalanyl-tRNA synthetase beta chain|nr:phenylalanine--tRNA ligase subunit beta [Lentisphaerota bacterium]
MKIPLSWLREYVDFDDTPEGLADKLTFAGVEVEGLATVGGGVEGVVVGEVTAIEKHPNADKLVLCRVNHGAAGEPWVVCGAPNAVVGGKYPFAPLGVVLPCGITIEKRKVRGTASEGMLCAEDELGISDDHTGLMELDARWAPGTALAEVMGPPETVLDVEITPDRPDCLCLVGLAREVAALYGTRLKMPANDAAESATPVETATSVKVEDLVDCPRYTARILRDVKVGPSPDWMKRRLEAAGIRAINNIVDITNYVMLETGQPLHAFDQKLLEGGRIVVRHPAPGEKIVTLDGVDRELTPEMLVIADAAKPMAVAGVMGGEFSGIGDDTTEVLLESASFRPVAIRDTSKKLELMSESAYRFIRGVDPELAEMASRRAAGLMVELASAKLLAGVVDVRGEPRKPWTVTCRPRRLATLLGMAPTAEEIAKIFESLELKVLSCTPELIEVEVPTFRGDLTREADLIEEYARLHLKNLPPVRSKATVVPDADDKPAQAQQRLREVLAGLGLQQIMNYSFLDRDLLDLFNREGAAGRVELANPLTADHTVLRDSLLPQMVETIGLNVSRQVAQAALFETGRIFRLDGEGHPIECDQVAVGLLGPVGRTGMDRFGPVGEEDMFLWIKGLWEQLATALKLRDASLRPADRPWSQPGRGMEVAVAGVAVGWLGLLRPDIAKEWRIHEPLGLFEAAVQPLVKDVGAMQELTPPPSYPSIRRDAALIVDGSVRHEQVLEIARRAAPPELEKIELFDIYQGKNLGDGRKSLAYAFTYRSPTGTLTDEAANEFQGRINAALKEQLPAEIREG